jgi:hypothetical protein
VDRIFSIIPSPDGDSLYLTLHRDPDIVNVAVLDIATRTITSSVLVRGLSAEILGNVRRPRLLLVFCRLRL